MKVEIYSDVACPWCYIGKRRFERALAAFPGAGEVEVVYRPYQLDPAAPATARPLLDALKEKFGPGAASMAGNVAEAARGEGITMDFDRALAANTLAAHRLLRLAERHDFVLVADECYAEVYRDAPPPGVLEVAREVGADPERVLAFHSLSKRSNLAGLRSGFVAGGPRAIARVRQLRSYAGAPLPLPLQRVAERAWADEAHVAASRALYQEKYRIADEVLGDLPGYRAPQAGFFLWLPVEDGEAAALRLWREAGVRALPGAYLAKDTGDGNPGQGFIRVALVAGAGEVRRGLGLLRDVLYR